MKKTFQDYQNEIGTRLKQYRVNVGMTQKDLEDRSGVSVRSISRMEQGTSVQFENIIRILIALNLADNIDLLIPDQSKRPSYYLKDIQKQRQRVRKKSETKKDFKWGDEE